MSKSFLNNLLKFYNSYESIKVGEEYIFSEARDLFIAAYYAYLKEHAADYKRDKELLKQAGIPDKKAVHITREKDGSYSMLINYRGGSHCLEHLEHFFQNEQGEYNPKGYYGEETVVRFNKEVFRVFDTLIARQNKR